MLTVSLYPNMVIDFRQQSLSLVTSKGRWFRDMTRLTDHGQKTR